MSASDPTNFLAELREMYTEEQRREAIRARMAGFGMAGAAAGIQPAPAPPAGSPQRTPEQETEIQRLLRLTAAAGMQGVVDRIQGGQAAPQPAADPLAAAVEQEASRIAPAPAGGQQAPPGGQGAVVNVQSGATVNVGGQAPAPAPAPAATIAPPPPTEIPPAPAGTELRRHAVTTRQETGVPAEETRPVIERLGAATDRATSGIEAAVGTTATTYGRARDVTDVARALADEADAALTGRRPPNIEALARAVDEQRVAAQRATEEVAAAGGRPQAWMLPDTGQKILEGIGMGLGTLGQAMFGRLGQQASNPAVDVLMETAKREADAERANAQARRGEAGEARSLYAAMVRQLGSDERAYRARLADKLRAIEMMLRGVSLEGKTADQVARHQEVLARVANNRLRAELEVLRAEYPGQTTTTQTTFEPPEPPAPTGGGRAGAGATPEVMGIEDLPPEFIYGQRALDPTATDDRLVDLWNMRRPQERSAYRRPSALSSIQAPERADIAARRAERAEAELEVAGHGRAANRSDANRARSFIGQYYSTDAMWRQVAQKYSELGATDRAQVIASQLPLLDWITFSVAAQAYVTTYVHAVRTTAITLNKGALSQPDVDAVQDAVPIALGNPRAAVQTIRQMFEERLGGDVRALLPDFRGFGVGPRPSPRARAAPAATPAGGESGPSPGAPGGAEFFGEVR